MLVHVSSCSSNTITNARVLIVMERISLFGLYHRYHKMLNLIEFIYPKIKGRHILGKWDPEWRQTVGTFYLDFSFL